MKRCKFENGYVGILKDNIAELLQKKGECRIIGNVDEQKVAAEKPADKKAQ